MLERFPILDFSELDAEETRAKAFRDRLRQGDLLAKKTTRSLAPNSGGADCPPHDPSAEC
jgi:hypothetical protein